MALCSTWRLESRHEYLREPKWGVLCILVMSLGLLAGAQPPGDLLEKMTQDLSLTSSQVEQVRAILQRHSPGQPGSTSTSNFNSTAPPGYDTSTTSGSRSSPGGSPPPDPGELEAALKKILTAEQWAKFQAARSRGGAQGPGAGGPRRP